MTRARRRRREGDRATARGMSPWAPLRHRVFAALFAAQLGSHIGTFFQTVAAAWLMGDLTTSPTLVALIQTASLLPLLLLGLPAGALADIFDRRLLLHRHPGVDARVRRRARRPDDDRPRHADGPAGVDVRPRRRRRADGSGLAGDPARPRPGPRVRSGGGAVQPDVQRRPGDRSGPRRRARRVGRRRSGRSSSTRPRSSASSWCSCGGGRNAVGVRLSTESLPGAVRAGLRYGVNAPALRGILVRTLAFAAPAAAIQALLPTVVRDQLDMGSGAYGILLGCFGIGAIVAAVAAAADRRRRSRATGPSRRRRWCSSCRSC